MFFKSNVRETPLTMAVLSDDLTTISNLGKYQDQVLSENELGFNSIELAQYLGKTEALKILRPAPLKDDFESRFQVKYLERSRFADYFFFQKVLNSCSWVFKTEFFAEGILEWGKKYRKGLPLFADVSIRWIDDVLGYGVFANRDMEPNEYVGEYVGVVHQIYRFKNYNNEYCLSYPKMPWGLRQFVVDSKYEGNESRFINHSDQPNLILKMALDRSLAHPLFFTNQPILKGTQLTFDYGSDYWRKRGSPVVI